MALPPDGVSPWTYVSPPNLNGLLAEYGCTIEILVASSETLDLKMTVNRIVKHEFGSTSDPALVLLHGLTEAGTAWPDAVRRWGSRWHITAPDQRGHGLSPRFRCGETTHAMDLFVRDLLDALPQH